jgi:hypothetical protein
LALAVRLHLDKALRAPTAATAFFQQSRLPAVAVGQVVIRDM